MSASAAQVRQWSEEVAADPGAPSFLPLARHYREAGRADAALRLVLRGLERHPHDVEAHYLLGLLYREAGDAVRAFDEWDIALALAPEHAGARREIGFLSAEREEWDVAVRHLERALEADIEDSEVREALERAWARSRGASAPRTSAPPAPAPPAPSSTADVVAPSPDGARPPAPSPATAAPPSRPSATAVPASQSSASPATPSTADAEWEGGRGWEALAGEMRALAGERGMVGAVLLDAQGYVLAGEMRVEGADRAAEVAAVLSGASAEAERALRHLKLGAWKGILVETPEAVVRLAPTGDGGMVAVAGRRDVPTGWVLRVAGRAHEAALRFLAALGGGGGG